MARKTYCWLVLVLSIRTALPAWSQQTGPAGAGDPPKKELVRTVSLVLDPQPEPERALAYRLETPYMEQRPGNGALLYQRAVSLVSEIKSRNPDLDNARLDDWYNSPVNKLPLDEVRHAIAKFEQPIHCLDLAGRCESCTWDYATREEGLPSTPPLLGDFRTLLRVLELKARLEMADGHPDAAIDALRIALSTARDIGNGPLVINNLVGLGLARGVTMEIERFVQSPNAPNLYWALTTLPHPLINMRQALQMETDAAYARLPELRRLDKEVLSNEQVIQVWNRAATGLGSPGERGLDHAVATFAMTAGAMKLYPRAKQYLLDKGKTMQEIESLPNLYVVLVYQHDRCRRLADAMLKWSDVPYWQVAPYLAKAEKQFHEEMGRMQQDMDAILLAFDYGMGNRFGWIHFVNTLLERDLAMLRCVEAIRLYAAGHDGRLPQALSDITEVPVPIDPVYGRAFSYRIVDGKALLESPAPPEAQDERRGLRYEIAIRQTAQQEHTN